MGARDVVPCEELLPHSEVNVVGNGEDDLKGLFKDTKPRELSHPQDEVGLELKDIVSVFIIL